MRVYPERSYSFHPPPVSDVGVDGRWTPYELRKASQSKKVQLNLRIILRAAPVTAETLIHGGTLVTPDGLLGADVLVRGELIAAIGHDLDAGGARVLDASGCYVLPGVIDGHTHVALDTGVCRTDDDWFAGTRAAACGGVTTLVDFATQFPGQGLPQAVEARLEEAQPAAVDYALHVMATDLPPGREGELGSLVELGAPSVKLYTTYRPTYYAGDATLLRLMEASAALGVLPLVHCENDDMVAASTEALARSGETGWRFHARSRPALAEQEAVQRVLFLAAAAGCPVHVCHCSTALSVALVAEARGGGQAVTCETCPQYLVLDDGVYDGPEPWRYVLQPPLRAPGEAEGLWALVAGGAVDTLVTDHCDYGVAQKRAHDDLTLTPGGLPGVETLLPLVYTHGVAGGMIDLPRMAALLSANPARLWGLWPRKGVLWPGADADLVVYDPEPEGEITAATLHHVAGYTPFEGMRVQGEVRATLSRGRVVYEGGEFTGEAGWGRFIRR